MRGGEDHASMDDSDRENFRRRGRSPASKRGGGHDRGQDRGERDELEFARMSEWGDNGRRDRTPVSNRGGDSSRERDRADLDFARGVDRRANGRRDRSPGSIGRGSHERERYEGTKQARGSEHDDNAQRRRERSPGSRRRAAGTVIVSRDREQSDREVARGLRSHGRRNTSPGTRRRRSKEREPGEYRPGRGSERGDNGRRDKSPGSNRGDSEDGGHEQDDFERRRGDSRRNKRSPGLRVAEYREKDGFPRGRSRREDDRRRGRSLTSVDNSVERDDGSPRGIRGITRAGLSPGDYALEQEDDGREDERDRRHVSHISRVDAVREGTSDSGSGELRSRDEDGSDRGESEEAIGTGKLQLMSKVEAGGNRTATDDDEDEDDVGGDDRALRLRDDRRLDVEKKGNSGEQSDEDESEDDRKRKKRKTKRREREREKESKKQSKRHRKRSVSRGRKRKHRRREASSVEAASDTGSSGASSSSNSEVSESEDSAQREKARRQRRKRRRKEKEREEEREKKRKIRRKKKELKEKKLRAELKKKKKEMRAKKPITDSWGKYGIIKDIDMWNKKPEFGAWLAEVKKVNTETLTNWEEKLMFKEYMEDYNTATFPSKKYYNLDIYQRRKVTKERIKGLAAKVVQVERTDFNDEDERRLELQHEREKQKEAEVEALMRKMQGGMAQDMKEQAQLREEMQYQFRLGNTEAAQSIQRRLDPDAEKFTK